MQSDEATPTPTPAGRTPARRRSSRRRRTSRNKRLAAALAVAVTVIGLLSQVTSLIDWIGDRFGDEPAATVAPEIVEVEPRSPSTLRDYKARVNESVKGLSDEQLDQVGRVFTVTMRIQGEQGNRFSLTWFLVSDETGERLRGRSFNQTPAIFEPRNDDRRRGYPVWIPTPPPGVYRATFVLTNAAGEQEDDAETEPFRVTPQRD